MMDSREAAALVRAVNNLNNTMKELNTTLKRVGLTVAKKMEPAAEVETKEGGPDAG